MVGRYVRDVEVVGSNPVTSINIFTAKTYEFVVFSMDFIGFSFILATDYITLKLLVSRFSGSVLALFWQKIPSAFPLSIPNSLSLF